MCLNPRGLGEICNSCSKVGSLSSMKTLITICKLDSQWEFAVWLRELNPVLCDNLERWDRVGDRKEDQDRGDICKPTADSC